MVHSAYDSFELINNSPNKIDAIESYGSNLLISHSDGSLRVYVPESSSTSVQSPPSDITHKGGLLQERYVLERTVNGFSRRQMLAMEVLLSRELLLSLSESIAFHRLPNLETLAVITKAKGANVYSWDDKRGVLAFGRQRRVCIFRHDGKRFNCFVYFYLSLFALLERQNANTLTKMYLFYHINMRTIIAITKKDSLVH